jgi:hypothetical protein
MPFNFSKKARAMSLFKFKLSAVNTDAANVDKRRHSVPAQVGFSPPLGTIEEVKTIRQTSLNQSISLPL